jgi:hypothetical protein
MADSEQQPRETIERLEQEIRELKANKPPSSRRILGVGVICDRLAATRQMLHQLQAESGTGEQAGSEKTDAPDDNGDAPLSPTS